MVMRIGQLPPNTDPSKRQQVLAGNPQSRPFMQAAGPGGYQNNPGNGYVPQSGGNTGARPMSAGYAPMPDASAGAMPNPTSGGFSYAALANLGTGGAVAQRSAPTMSPMGATSFSAPTQQRQTPMTPVIPNSFLHTQPTSIWSGEPGAPHNSLQENVNMAGIGPGGQRVAYGPQLSGGSTVSGGGGSGSAADQVQSAQDKANAANEQRYQQLLSMSGQLSNSAQVRNNQQRNWDLGRVQQDAISAGLGNSTVLPNLEMGVEDQSALRSAEIGDQGLKTAMGIIERRTDQQPNYSLLASLLSRPGATGGSFGGGGSFVAGAGGGGGDGGSGIYGALGSMSGGNGMGWGNSQGSDGAQDNGSSDNTNSYKRNAGFDANGDGYDINGWGQKVPNGQKRPQYGVGSNGWPGMNGLS